MCCPLRLVITSTVFFASFSLEPGTRSLMVSNLLKVSSIGVGITLNVKDGLRFLMSE